MTTNTNTVLTAVSPLMEKVMTKFPQLNNDAKPYEIAQAIADVGTVKEINTIVRLINKDARLSGEGVTSLGKATIIAKFLFDSYQSATGETLVAEQQTKEKEESNMTQQNKDVVTVEVLQETVKGIGEMIMGVVARQDATIGDIQNTITGLTQTISERIDEAARYTRSLENQIKAMQAGQPAPTPEQQVAATQEPQYTTDQQAHLKAVAHNPSAYQMLKNTFDRANEARVSVYGTIHNVADTVDKYGHSGVEGIANLLDSIVDGITGVGQQVLDVTSTVAHSAVDITKQVGHTGVDAVSGTIRMTGDVVGKKE